MATSLMFRNGNQLDVLVLIDVVVTELHASDVQITDHPVEKGVDITDHFQPRPRGLKLDCVLTDTPLEVGQPAAPGRSKDAYAAIERLQAEGKLITVTTSLRQYENLLVEHLSAPVDASTGDGLKFSITLREIRTVESKTVPVRVSVPRAAKPVNLGKQTPKQADPALTEKVKSEAVKLYDSNGVQRGFGRIFGT